MRVLRKPAVSITISVLVILSFYYFTSTTSSLQEPKPLKPDQDISKSSSANNDETTVEIPFMPKMANETIK